MSREQNAPTGAWAAAGGHLARALSALLHTALDCVFLSGGFRKLTWLSGDSWGRQAACDCWVVMAVGRALVGPESLARPICGMTCHCHRTLAYSSSHVLL